MLTIIASILVFSIIVLVHEYGHYKAAVSVGIHVYEFAIGMGPTIYKKEKNGTIYSIRALPIGGFVQMEGEDEDVRTSSSYITKSVAQRFKVIAAGPVMNFILALVIFVIIAFVYGTPGTTVNLLDETSNEYMQGLRSGDQIISINDKKVYIWDEIYYEIAESESDTYTATVKRNNEVKELNINKYRKMVGITSKTVDGQTTNIVSPQNENSPAYKAGVRDNDKIVAVNDIPISTWEDIIKQVDLSEDGKEIKLTIERDGQLLDISVLPQLDISIRYNTKWEKSFMTVVVSSAYKTVYYIQLMFKTIGQLVTGKIGSDAIGGPVMVVKMVSEAANDGLLSLLNLAAFISINLGFMNLLPIPALDGSKLVFLIVEGIRGKAVPIEKEGYIHFVGFIILISFMLFITYKDILRLFKI